MLLSHKVNQNIVPGTLNLPQNLKTSPVHRHKFAQTAASSLETIGWMLLPMEFHVDEHPPTSGIFLAQVEGSLWQVRFLTFQPAVK